MRPEQLLYRQAAAERIVAGISEIAAPQVQYRLDGFPTYVSTKRTRYSYPVTSARRIRLWRYV